MNKVLIEEIQRNRKKIGANPIKYTNGRGAEPKVKTDLLPPLLTSLGWKTDTNSVEVEYTVDCGDVDFALVKEDKPIFLIEVKALGKDIGPKSPGVLQLLDYLIDLDLYFCIVTDGAIWNLYSRSGRRANIEWSINLVEDEPSLCAKRLMMISFDSVDVIAQRISQLKAESNALAQGWAKLQTQNDIVVDKLIELLIENMSKDNMTIDPDEAKWFLETIYPTGSSIITSPTPRKALVATILKSKVRKKRSSRHIRKSISTTKRDATLIWDTILKDRPLPGRGKSPISMQIGKEHEVEIGHWIDIFAATAEWLIERGDLKETSCPFPTGPTWYRSSQKKALINTTPKNPDGSAFPYFRELSNGLFMNTNHNADSLIKLSWFMLEFFGIDSTILEVRW